MKHDRISVLLGWQLLLIAGELCQILLTKNKYAMMRWLESPTASKNLGAVLSEAILPHPGMPPHRALMREAWESGYGPREAIEDDEVNARRSEQESSVPHPGTPSGGLSRGCTVICCGGGGSAP